MVFGRLKKKQQNPPVEDKPAVEDQSTPADAPDETPKDTPSESSEVADGAAATEAPAEVTGAQETTETAGVAEASTEAPGTSTVTGQAAAGVVVSRDNGPFDLSEQNSETGYIDLGALRIGAAEGLQLRLEVEEKTKRVIAVTLDLNGSNLQLQAFAAPRTDGLWDDIRAQIGVSVGSQGGTVQDRVGSFGTELVAKLPAKTPDGQPGYRVARFIGVDGPRWFLRGVIGGPAAINREAAEPIEELFRRVVVVRGDHPLPPRELLQLRLPKETATAQPPAPAPDLTDPLRRGPEITHIG